jgi:hypothetical protein
MATWARGYTRSQGEREKRQMFENIKALAEQHKLAEILDDLIQKDGAGSWPPLANHTESVWPATLRAYKKIYQELAPLIPQAEPSLDDALNLERVSRFRSRFRELLSQEVDLEVVKEVSDTALKSSKMKY